MKGCILIAEISSLLILVADRITSGGRLVSVAGSTGFLREPLRRVGKHPAKQSSTLEALATVFVSVDGWTVVLGIKPWLDGCATVSPICLVV